MANYVFAELCVTPSSIRDKLVKFGLAKINVVNVLLWLHVN